MDEKPKLNLQQHVAKRVSRKYLWKIIFYVVMLTAISFFVANYMNKKEKEKAAKPKVQDVTEVHNITIEQ